MKYTFFTTGPSQLYPTVAQHIDTALQENILSVSHRSEKFQTVFKGVTEGIKTLLKIPSEYHIVLVSSGTEAMERIIENTVKEKSFHFINGSFSKKWHEISLLLKKNAQKYEVDFGKGFHSIPDISRGTELICFTHNETSSGVATDTEFLYTVAHQNPDALIAVDTVSSAPYVNLDYKKLDIVFFSVQKLFGLPAGLGVLILSPRAIEKARLLQRQGDYIGSYHNFLSLVEWAENYQTPETPNVLGIYLLNRVVNDMNKKGIEKIRQETEEKAKLLYKFLEQHHIYKPFVEENDRSTTVIVAEVGEGRKVLEKVKEKGFIVGSGYGPRKEQQIRIANFPAISKKDIEVLLQYL